METKYNYVFYNFFEDYYQPVVLPLVKYPFVRVYANAFNTNKFVQAIFKFHWSSKVNHQFELPFKKNWYKKMILQDFNDNKPCCFIFLTGKYILQDHGLYKYIKSLNKNNKIVILCGDLISKKDWDINRIKSVSDMVVTYDKGEAEKYDFSYVPWENSYGAITEVNTPDSFLYDVYFLGFAKDRLPEIHSAYERFTAAGLRCNFVVCGTKAEERIKGEGLHYSSPISYMENLENVNNSRCVLEIIQGDSVAPTLRFYEAYTYKRRLITNNKNPIYGKYIEKENLYVHSDTDEIDLEAVAAEINYDGFVKTDDFSSLCLIEFLENNLDELTKTQDKYLGLK